MTGALTRASTDSRETWVDRDVALLFATRCLRMFGYGFLATVLVLYLTSLGYSGGDIGLLLTLTLLGDAAISLWLTTHADRIGRRRVLIAGAGLMLVAGLAFVATPIFAVLAVAATIGVISPSGNEVGPFLAVEQASLSQLVAPTRRTGVFAWYQLVGSFATAHRGPRRGRSSPRSRIDRGAAPADAYRLVIVGYALVGIVLAALFTRLGREIEVAPRDIQDVPIRTRLGLHRSQRIVLSLSMLFALDAFAGGFVVASFIAFWFQERWQLDPAALGRSCSARTSWPGCRRWPPARWQRGSAS